MFSEILKCPLNAHFSDLAKHKSGYLAVFLLFDEVQLFSVIYFENFEPVKIYI